MSYAEIAHLQGTTAYVVRVRLHRAKERLRRIIQHSDDEAHLSATVARALGTVCVVSSSSLFAQRVLAEVQTMGMHTLAHPSVSTLNPGHHALSFSGWKTAAGFLTGWKIAAGLVGVLAVTGLTVTLLGKPAGGNAVGALLSAVANILPTAGGELHALPEPVLAVQRRFPQATVRLLPEVRYNGEIAPTLLMLSPSWSDPFETSTISPDGRRLFFVRWADGGWQSYFLDLTTGQASLAKMLDQQQQVEFAEDTPFPFIDMGVWDPVEPAYLYASTIDHLDVDDALKRTTPVESIWRIHVETLVGTQILPPDVHGLSGITPDGRYLLLNRFDGEGIQRSLYSLETHIWTPQPADMGRTYAPNGELVAGVQNNVLTIKDVTTDRVPQGFNADQDLLALPHGKDPMIMGHLTWLCNSAGLLVNIRSRDADMTENTIWQVGIDGEAAAIVTGVAVIGNSQNGRYWLLQHEQQFYVMTLETD